MEDRNSFLGLRGYRCRILWEFKEGKDDIQGRCCPLWKKVEFVLVIFCYYIKKEKI
jgi:hypothetical protein